MSERRFSIVERRLDELESSVKGCEQFFTEFRALVDDFLEDVDLSKLKSAISKEKAPPSSEGEPVAPPSIFLSAWPEVHQLA